MKRLTEGEVYERLVDKPFTLLSPYINIDTKVDVRCNICNHEWRAIPKTLFKGNGCPECGKKKAASVKKWNITQEQFVERVKEIHGNDILILGEYTSVHSSLEVKCNKCGRVWDSKPAYLYTGYGCKPCSRKLKGIKSRMAPEVFLKRVYDIHGDTIEVLETYEVSDVPISVRCTQCGYEWRTYGKYLLQDRGCPHCRRSRGEQKIEQILKDNNIEFVCEYVFDDLVSPDGGKFRFDFAVFKDGQFSYLIEYDGIGHFKPYEIFGGQKRFEVYQRNDRLKNEYCQRNNIKLIRISYKQYKDLDIGMVS